MSALRKQQWPELADVSVVHDIEVRAYRDLAMLELPADEYEPETSDVTLTAQQCRDLAGELIWAAGRLENRKG